MIADRRQPFVAAGMVASISVMTFFIAAYFASRGSAAGFADLAHDGYQLREVLDLLAGGRVFSDTFDQYGPLAPMLNVIGFVTLGRTLLAIKYFIALWYAVTAVAMYAVARHFLERSLSLVAVGVWLGLAPFYQQGIMISPHAYASLVQAGTMLAVLAYIRTGRIASLLVAGALCGVTCLLKESIGALLLSSLLIFLALDAMPRRSFRGAIRSEAAVLGSFGVVVAVSALHLFMRGSLHDWYLQTIVFPRAFYLDAAAARVSRVDSLALWAVEFVKLQAAAEPVWFIVRSIVIVSAVVAVAGGANGDRRLVLAGCMTAILWLGAFPSAAFMHQWWTAALAIPPAVYIIRAVALRVLAPPIASRRRLLGVNIAAAAALSIIVAPAAVARADAAADRTRSLSASLAVPPAFAGLRTDPVTARSVEALYDLMTTYRVHHPGALVASIDGGDGKSGRVAESLPLLSFLPDNRHPHPVYWNLPVLSNTVYPDYGRTFDAFVRSVHPLLVDSRRTGEGARRVAGYTLLAAVPSPAGHWFLYSPEHDERLAHGERTAVFDEPPAPPVVEYVTIAQEGRQDRARAYVWPATAAVSLDAAPWARLGAVGDVVYESRELSRSSRGLAVDGPVDAPYSYLLRVKQRSLHTGEYFYAQGEVIDGGLTVGLQTDDRWIGSVNVDRTGRFAVLVAAPCDGEYGLVLANYVATPWWRRLVRFGRISNAVRIDTAGWASPSGVDR